MIRLRALALAAEFVVFFGMTTLFQGMRGVMRLGGFVASGGPYAIAHPAPDWIWIIPASILPMILMFFAHFFLTSSTGAIPLVLPFWSGLFLSLGYNFLEFTLRPPAGMGFPGGWLVCGIVFVAMGAAPLFWAGSIVTRILRQAGAGPARLPAPAINKPASRLFLILQLAIIPAAIAASAWAFGIVTR